MAELIIEIPEEDAIQEVIITDPVELIFDPDRCLREPPIYDSSLLIPEVLPEDEIEEEYTPPIDTGE